MKVAPPPGEHAPAAGRIGVAGWMAIAALLVLLAGGLLGVYLGWTSHSGGIEMPAWGYAILGVGILFAMAIGSGLMALVFYSSRKGYDEPFNYDTGRQDQPLNRPPDRS